MSKLQPLPSKDLAIIQPILNAAKKGMGFVPNSIKIMARIPAIVGSFGMLTANIIGQDGLISPFTAFKMAFKNLGWTAKNMKDKNRAPLYLKNLVAHVSSNASGCRYCQAHTAGEAFNHGASIEKIEAVWDFENSAVFDAAEKAALRFGFAAGQVPNAVTEEHFSELRKHFSEKQIVDLGATIALFGFLNRWNDTFGTTLEEEPIAFAKKHLAKSGWEIGKHLD
ncbi:MAG: carboxymuconolactone decarboxylase family protein [Bacteroidota bacterium]